MHRLILLALLCATPAFTAAAQSGAIPDTVAAWRYAPLGIGDEWVYDGNYTASVVIRIEGDTLIDGLRYVREVSRVRSNQGGPLRRTVAFVRFDTAAAVVVAAPGSQGGPLDRYRHRFPGLEGRFDRGLAEAAYSGCYGGPCGVSSRQTEHSFGPWRGPWVTHVLLTKILRLQLDAHTAYGVDVGFLSWVAWALDMPSTSYLRYANIGGKAYGTRPLWAVDASAEARPAAQAVRAFPQPFASRLTVEAPHIARGEAVLSDLLGRRVAHVPVEDGQAEIDGSALAPGVYALRVCADGGGACTTRAVVRR